MNTFVICTIAFALTIILLVIYYVRRTLRQYNNTVEYNDLKHWLKYFYEKFSADRLKYNVLHGQTSSVIELLNREPSLRMASLLHEYMEAHLDIFRKLFSDETYWTVVLKTMSHLNYTKDALSDFRNKYKLEDRECFESIYLYPLRAVRDQFEKWLRNMDAGNTTTWLHSVTSLSDQIQYDNLIMSLRQLPNLERQLPNLDNLNDTITAYAVKSRERIAQTLNGILANGFTLKQLRNIDIIMDGSEYELDEAIDIILDKVRIKIVDIEEELEERVDKMSEELQYQIT